MTASVRSVNVDHVKRLVEAVRIGDGFDMEKILRAASDIGGYAPETNPRYEPDGRKEASDDIERFEWVARWLGLKEPEAEVCSIPMGNRIRLPISLGSICWLFWKRSAKVSRWIGISGSGAIQSGTGKTRPVQDNRLQTDRCRYRAPNHRERIGKASNRGPGACRE